MLKLVINYIIFLCILAIQLFSKKKAPYFFVLIYALYIYLLLKYGVTNINGDVMAVEMTIFFVLAFVFNIKQCILLLILTTLLFLKFKYLYFDNMVFILLDIIIVLLYIILGTFCKRKIYIDSYPDTFSGIPYAIVCTTLYAFVYFILSFIFNEKGVFIKNYISIALLLRLEKSIPAIVSSFFIINIFNKQDKSRNNRLINIFVKKYGLLVTIFSIFAVVFCIVFNFLYTEYNYEEILKFNYSMAKNDLMASRDKYGDDCLDVDKTTKAVFGTWTLDLAGAVYVLDEDFNMVADFYDTEDEFLNDKEFSVENFKNIASYDKDKVFTYKNDKHYYMAIYDIVGSYYLLAFFSYDKLSTQVFAPTMASLFMIIINILFMFALAYGLFKKYVVNTLSRVNKKLDKITNGDYDVVFTESSSDEFKQLSNSINSTVSTLKTNIETIENKNKEELILARKIQVSQLPLNKNITIGYTGYGINIPAEDVGGDFYDDFSIDNSKRIILVADVSGKGIPGALFMMKAKHTIINLAKQYNNMEVMFEEVNKILSDNNPSIMFVTCFAIMIDTESGRLSMINAGHNLPILIKNNNKNKECNFIDMKPSHILGIDMTSKYVSKEMLLSEGDSIILYTDGVTEAKNVKKEQYGNERFLEAVKNIKNDDPEKITQEIVDGVKHFAGEEPQSDDITIYCLRYNGHNNSLTLKTDKNAIDKGKVFINKFIKVYNIEKNLSRNLNVVFDEIICNIIKYAYKDGIGDVTIGLNIINNDTIEMIFIDKGIEFNPIIYDNNSSERTLDDKINGGMGIMFCKNMMDSMKYERKDGCNILKLYKRF